MITNPVNKPHKPVNQVNTSPNTQHNTFRPVKPVRPSIIQCDFCGLNTNESSITTVTSIQRQFKICPRCYNKFSNHRCIMCNESTKTEDLNFEWKGLCQKCAQLVMQGAEKLKNEQEQGVDFEATLKVIPNPSEEIEQSTTDLWLATASSKWFSH